MRIVHIVSSIDLSAGGPPKSVSDLALNQAMLGVNVTIFTNKSSNPYLKESIHPNLKLIFVTGSFKKSLIEYLAKEKIDLLHGHSLWQMPIHHMSKIARKKNIPYIITPRGTLEPWALNAKKLKKKLALLIYQRKDLEKADCIHATARMEVDSMRRLEFRNHIALIPNGIDLKEFHVRSLQQNLQKKTILFLSRIHPKKGIEMLIDAWQRLEKSLRKNWKVEIAGNGEETYVASLQKLITEKGLAEEIKIIGPQFGKNKLVAYHRADLFVLPTYSENFGIVVAEALAYGIPVITTKGTPWEELNTSNSGWWIDIGVEPLTETLTNALKTSEIERNQMGMNGRKLIEQNYSIKSVAAQTIDLYRWILDKTEKPSFVQ